MRLIIVLLWGFSIGVLFPDQAMPIFIAASVVYGITVGIISTDFTRYLGQFSANFAMAFLSLTCGMLLNLYHNPPRYSGYYPSPEYGLVAIAVAAIIMTGSCLVNVQSWRGFVSVVLLMFGGTYLGRQMGFSLGNFELIHAV